jgi:hypothetical protein
MSRLGSALIVLCAAAVVADGHYLRQSPVQSTSEVITKVRKVLANDTLEEIKAQHAKVNAPIIEKVTKKSIPAFDHGINAIMDKLSHGHALQTLPQYTGNATKLQLDHVNEYIVRTVMDRFITPNSDDNGHQNPSNRMEGLILALENALKNVQSAFANVKADLNQLSELYAKQPESPAFLEVRESAGVDWTSKLTAVMGKFNADTQDFINNVRTIIRMLDENPSSGKNSQAKKKLESLINKLVALGANIGLHHDSVKEISALRNKIANSKSGAKDIKAEEIAKWKSKLQKLETSAATAGTKIRVLKKYEEVCQSLISACIFEGKREITLMRNGRINQQGKLATSLYESLGVPEIMSHFRGGLNDRYSVIQRLYLEEKKMLEIKRSLNESITAKESDDVVDRIKLKLKTAEGNIQRLHRIIAKGLAKEFEKATPSSGKSVKNEVAAEQKKFRDETNQLKALQGEYDSTTGKKNKALREAAKEDAEVSGQEQKQQRLDAHVKAAAEHERRIAALQHQLLQQRKIKQLEAQEAEALGRHEDVRKAREAIRLINQKALANEKMLLAASEKGKSIEDDAKAAQAELERLMERAKKSEMLAEKLKKDAHSKEAKRNAEIGKLKDLKAKLHADLGRLKANYQQLAAKINAGSGVSTPDSILNNDDLNDQAQADAKSQIEAMLQGVSNIINARNAAKFPQQPKPAAPAPQQHVINIVVGCGKKCKDEKDHPKGKPKPKTIDAAVKKAVASALKDKAAEDADRLERRRLELEHDQRVQEQAASEVQAALEAKRDLDDQVLLLKGKLGEQKKNVMNAKSDLQNTKAIGSVDRQKAEEESDKMKEVSDIVHSSG